MKRNEILSQTHIFEEMERRKKELTELIAIKEKAMEAYPPGSIHAMKKDTHFEYYLRLDSADKSGKYIKKKEQGLIKALAQKKYDEYVLNLAKRELADLNCASKWISDTDQIQLQYRRLNPGLRPYVQAVDLEDDDFIQMWEDEHFLRKNTDNLETEYFTDKGEHVRSKTEINIGNALTKNGIPYRYEAELPFSNPRNYHPDFTILKKKTREILYWEHLGMMDKRSYAVDAVEKIRYYQRYGIILGKNLIVTMETADNQLGTKEIQRVIDELLLK